MKTKTQNLDIEKVFRALSDLTRLRILNLLRGGELCVCDLIDVLDLPQSTVSRHLAYLRKTNLVTSRKEGLWHYYQLAPAELKFSKKIMECIEASCDVIPLLDKDVQSLQSSSCSDCCG